MYSYHSPSCSLACHHYIVYALDPTAGVMLQCTYSCQSVWIPVICNHHLLYVYDLVFLCLLILHCICPGLGFTIASYFIMCVLSKCIANTSSMSMPCFYLYYALSTLCSTSCFSDSVTDCSLLKVQWWLLSFIAHLTILVPTFFCT